MSFARHTHSPREVGFFVEAALSPLSVSSVEWADNGGVVQIYTTPDPLHTLRDIANWTKFSKPGGSGTFNLPAGTRKVAIEAASHDPADFSVVTVVSDGLTNMEQARIYGVDQLIVPSSAVLPPEFANVTHWYSGQELNKLWQDAARTIPVTATGDRVGAVDNQGSAAPAFLSQPISIERPTYKTTLVGAGGLGFLDGDNLGRWLVGTALTAALTGQTVALVWWNRIGGIKLPIGDLFLFNSSPDWTIAQRGTAGTMRLNNGLSGSSSVAILTANTVAGVVNSNDGVTTTENYSTDVGSVSPASFALFPQIGDLPSILADDIGNVDFDGALGDVIVYDKGLGATSFAQLIAFLETRWSMTFL